MKRKLIELGQALLVTQMNHLVLIVFAITMMGLFNREQPYLLLWIGVGVLPAGLYFVRSGVRNFFLFFALHLMLPVAVFFVPVDLILKLVIMVIVLIYVIWSISIRLKAKTSKEYLVPPVFAVCAIGALTLIENLQCKKGWESYYLLAAIIYLSGYFIYYFISQYLRFLVVNESSAANIPEREIFSSGMMQTFLFTLGGMLVLFLTANISWVSYILSWVGKALVALLRMLFSGVAYEEIEEIPPITVERPQQVMGMFRENSGPHIIWIILEKLVMIAFAVGLIVAVVLAVLAGLRYLWEYFHAAGKKQEKELQKGMDIRETCTVEKNKKEAVRWFSFLNNRERIRKIYRKQILKNKNDIIGNHNPEVLERMTAKECCEKIPAEKDAADLLEKIYEKARYSQEDITAEDVRLVKSTGK